MKKRDRVVECLMAGLALLVGGCAAEKDVVAQPLPSAPAVSVAQAMPEKTLDRAIDVLVQQIVSSLPAEKKPLTAVLDFNDLSGNVSAFGRLVGEELVTKLFQTKRVRVVERGLLEKALNELKFNLSEVVDPARAKQLGKQVGADAIVTGTITDLGSSVKINARLIEVEKGDVLAAAGAEVTKDQVVSRLMSQILTGSGKAPATKQPAEKTAEAAPPPPPPVAAREMPKFENQGLRVSVKSLRKEGNVIKMDLVYRNLLDVGKPDISLYLSGGGNRYIADEEGEQWVLQQDSPFSKIQVTSFPPQVNVRVPLTFASNGGTLGKTFNLVLDHACSGNSCDSVGWQVRVLIRGITAE